MRRPANKSTINISAMARKVDVDNRIPLRNYYRIADNLLKQANIYREEKNIIDLYIILLRYSSLVSETIPFHRDYQALYPKERTSFRKKLSSVLDELEALKPEAQRQLHDRGRVEVKDEPSLHDGEKRAPSASASFQEWPTANNRASLSYDNQRQACTAQSSWKRNDNYSLVPSTSPIDKHFQKLNLSLPLPKQETLSRHSFLGPNGLHGQWLGSTTEIKVNYPINTDLASNEVSSLDQDGKYEIVTSRDGDLEVEKSAMASVLSLDDGRWSSLDKESARPFDDEVRDIFPLVRQPSPPPVLAQVQPEYLPISPSKVADPRPGPAKSFSDGTASSNSYQHLHIPVKMMDDFLRLAQKNTSRNLETCGVLAGTLKNRVFHITTLIVPKQESTSDSCQTLNEEEIFDVQDKCSLFPLGWIHTHPSQTCFMSSVDLHTHYSYQVMLPEAIAIVMAPTDTSSPHGIFHLSDPGGVAVIRNCQQRGFHPHEAAEDGSPIYEHCSHVYMNSNLKFDVVDLR
ncbi:AMSH-like ubiquitin thioesterase 3 isoform X1 [Coffea arabica]|nr:AMSH-like ubiquitin thioesterase 3 isoform X1 [Coffea arabica]